VFGIFGAMFVILRRLRQSTAAVLPIIVINLFFTFTIPNISAAGHVGGLISGALVMAGFAYAPKHARIAVQVGTAVGFAVLLAVVTAAQTSALTH
jgi:membrane associated rhomboid family serine protease